jgi:hypothetical protein
MGLWADTVTPGQRFIISVIIIIIIIIIISGSSSIFA